MAKEHATFLLPTSPEYRRVAAGQFERANQVVATGNFDYGIRLLLSCCQLDPGNLIYRQALRRTEKAKYRNNMRGSMLAWLTSWPAKARVKAAKRARDYLKVLEYGERVLARNPWDVGTQMDMAEAADLLGLLDLAVWNLEQARQKSARDPGLNRALALLYEKRGNFSQAMALWDQVRKVKPRDEEVAHKLRDLAVHETISRGQYEAMLGTSATVEEDDEVTTVRPTSLPRREAEPYSGAPSRGAALPVAPSAANERTDREAAALRARLQSDPTNPTTYLQLAAVYRKAGQWERAAAVLREGLGPTGNTFELAAELADLEIEPFRRNLALTEEKLQAAPEDPELRKIRVHLRKEINTRELELSRLKADRFPTEMGYRYEVGVRLLRAGQVDEAIQELQASRADPRHRWQSLLYLGHCFKARNNWRLAQRNYEDALQILPGGETAARKDLLFLLAQGSAETGDLTKAVDLAHELANEDFTYRDIGRLLDEWQARLQQADAP
jgi:tetratricopeptide (TPR) repeat protein